MIAVLGGLGAALAWATTTLCARRSSRLLGPYAAVAWVMLVGVVVLTPLALIDGKPADLDLAAAAWIVVAGLGAVGGLVSIYAGLRVGQVGVVAPIAATEGAITAVIAVAFGEEVGLLSGLVLGAIVIGVVMASTTRDDEGVRAVQTGAWFGVAAALFFGVSLYCLGRSGDDVGALWTLYGMRLVALATLIVPLVALRRMRLVRGAVPYVVGAGLLELVGGVSFIVGADRSIAVAGVMASQYAVVAVVVGYLALGERLGRVQFAGVAATLAGVTALAALQA